MQSGSSLRRIAFFACVVCAGALLCFGYGLVFIVFFRANEAKMLSLGQLINRCTARSETIFIVKEDDPGTAAMAARLEEPLDRHFEVVNDLQSVENETNRWAILSSVKLDNSLPLRGQSAAEAASFLTTAADWFNHAIAHRPPGDRLPLSETYYIYGPANDLFSRPGNHGVINAVP
jgi:hypothetical protein